MMFLATKLILAGLAIGIDEALSPRSSIGAVFAFGNSNMSSKNSAAPGSININSYQAGIYGDTYLSPSLQMNYQLDGGINANKEYRNLSSFNNLLGVSTNKSGANANASYTSLSAHVGTSIRKFVYFDEKYTFIPSMRLDYTTVRSQGYTENGAGALNLSVASQNYNMLPTSADLRIDRATGERAKLSINAGAGYNLLNNQVQSTAAYQGGGPVFAVNGLQTLPWVYSGGVGVSGAIAKDVEVNLRYDVQFTNSGYNNQMVSGKVKIFY